MSGDGDDKSDALATSPARATPCSAEEAARRLAVVLDLMASARWDRAACKALAAEWGVVPRTVRDYSRMASKMLWSSDEDVAELRVDTIARLTRLADKAEGSEEYRSAIAALEARATVAGVVKAGPAAVVHVDLGLGARAAYAPRDLVPAVRDMLAVFWEELGRDPDRRAADVVAAVVARLEGVAPPLGGHVQPSGADIGVIVGVRSAADVVAEGEAVE